ncbi:MAG TPA: rhodanese-like domain-containing protein [Puia sp.]|nr:rhodanese-like domain-containing protein [Puia sp.]
MSTLISRLFGRSEDLKAIYQQGAIILDVRTLPEFRSGHIEGAMHIPLDQLAQRTGELKRENKPIIACCASGMRSGTAKSMLSSAGIEAYNGGSWQMLRHKLR